MDQEIAISYRPFSVFQNRHTKEIYLEWVDRPQFIRKARYAIAVVNYDGTTTPRDGERLAEIGAPNEIPLKGFHSIMAWAGPYATREVQGEKRMYGIITVINKKK